MATTTEASGQTTNTGAAAQQLATYKTVLRPLVDIVEDSEGVTLQADVPGVSRENLNVRIDGTTLLIDGQVQFAQARLSQAQLAQAQSVQGSPSDSGSTHYRRTFALSRELETERIEATVKDGVLTVRIPKRAELRPRKIEIQ